MLVQKLLSLLAVGLIQGIHVSGLPGNIGSKGSPDRPAPPAVGPELPAVRPKASDARPGAGDVLIGYRIVHADQAKEYEAAGTLTWDESKAKGGKQIGKGVYTSAKADGWIKTNPDNVRFAIFANAEKFKRLPKVWVPKDRMTDLDIPEAPAYIRSLGLDPDKSLAMSFINGLSYNDLQMVIPPGLLKQNNGGLDFKLRRLDEDHLQEQPVVRYDLWHNVKGADPLKELQKKLDDIDKNEEFAFYRSGLARKTAELEGLKDLPEDDPRVESVKKSIKSYQSGIDQFQIDIYLVRKELDQAKETIMGPQPPEPGNGSGTEYSDSDSDSGTSTDGDSEDENGGDRNVGGTETKQPGTRLRPGPEDKTLPGPQKGKTGGRKTGGRKTGGRGEETGSSDEETDDDSDKETDSEPEDPEKTKEEAENTRDGGDGSKEKQKQKGSRWRKFLPKKFSAGEGGSTEVRGGSGDGDVSGSHEEIPGGGGEVPGGSEEIPGGGEEIPGGDHLSAPGRGRPGVAPASQNLGRRLGLCSW
ncbi:hypothetical protein L249_1761 [Ophiocordyceps polyrhachis-furcata BCC 54312]|uniref:Uncharacterized protein n=1 Tax=Ophiocordyceps polyrhachis-furcata BCC 54312 TaxID=1330021 RepID=A0A367LNB6_9HYPO|nr:hypothetical protein L249_1761 [Ophiocordyceps polyrhachis-furcata BCC 54312]